MQSAFANAQKWGTLCATTAPIALISVQNLYCTRPGTNIIAICVPDNTPVSQKSSEKSSLAISSHTCLLQRLTCTSSFCNISSEKGAQKASSYPDHKSQDHKSQDYKSQVHNETHSDP